MTLIGRVLTYRTGLELRAGHELHMPKPGEDPNTLEGCENSGTPVGCDGISYQGICDGDVIMTCAWPQLSNDENI